MVTIGWKAGTEQYQPDELLEDAIAAEKAGFESIDVSDHFHPWSEAGASPFVWTWLGATVARTQTIELGTGLTCPILRYHPSIIAQAAATVSYMLKKRLFYLGVGTGEALNEYAATGLWPGYTERQMMLAEAMQLMRQLWTGEETTFSGEYYETKKAKLYTPPPKTIPIYISSLVPNSAYFAGQHGDGFLTVGGKTTDIYKQMLKNFSDGAKAAGKDPTKMPKLIEVNVAYSDDKKTIIKQFKKYWAGTMILALFDQKIYTPKMSQMNGEVVGTDTIEEKMCISTDPKEHIDFLRQYADLGFTHINVHYSGPDQKKFIEDYGKNVIPKVKSRL